MKRTACILSALALAAMASSAAAQGVPPPSQSAAAIEPSGLDAIRQGLAGLMRRSARHLASGERFEATEALNEARHLGEAAGTAKGLGPEAARAFKAAREAVTKARHTLQNGKPEGAGRILTEAAAALEQTQLGGAASAKIDENAAKNAAGRIVLNTHGETLGDLRGVDAPPQGPPVAHVVLGGLFGIGGRVVAVPTEMMLIGDTYVALSSDVKRKDLESR